MRRCVLDASALFAFLNDEEGADMVEERLADEEVKCLVHAINLCEVFYGVLAKSGAGAAAEAVEELRPFVTVREDLDEPLWRNAGELKVHVQQNSKNRGSIADALCAALGRREECEVVTTDHSNFDALARDGLCTVRFLR